MNTVKDLSEKIEKARALDFGDLFNKAIELYKKTWVQGLLLQVFTIIVMLPLILIFYMPFIGMIMEQQRTGYADPEAMNNFFQSMSVVYIIVVAIGGVLLGAISGALNAAFFRIMKKIDYDEAVTTSDFMYFIKGKYLGKILVLMLIAVVIAIPSALLCYIPLIYFIVPLSYILVVFAFNEELSVGQIISMSFKLGNKKWLMSFGLLFLSYVAVVILSFVSCGIGGIFFQSFLFHPLYLIYREVVGFDEKSAIDEIGTLIE